MIRIHEILQEGKYPSAENIALEIEVAKKTVLRDLNFMRDTMKLPAEYDNRKKGWYYSEPVGAFPTAKISQSECLGFVLLQKALKQLQGGPFEKFAEAAIGKVMELLPESISMVVNDWENAISFDMSAPSIYPPEMLYAVCKGTAERKEMIVSYKNQGEKEPKDRLLHSHHVACINMEWYMFARDVEKNVDRTFIPARIKAVRETGKKFPDPKFSLKKRLEKSFGVFSGDGDYTVVLRFAPRVADIIKEKRWRCMKSLRDIEGGGVEMNLVVSSLPEIQRWIQSYGRDVEVLEPAELRRNVRCEGIMMAENNA